MDLAIALLAAGFLTYALAWLSGGPAAGDARGDEHSAEKDQTDDLGDVHEHS